MACERPETCRSLHAEVYELIEMTRDKVMSLCICVVQSEVKINCLVCEGTKLVWE